jgi:hypothetical protein
MRSYWYSLKKHFPFTKQEKSALLISLVVLTIITAFNDGSDSFQIDHWLLNLFFVFIMVLLSFGVRHLGYRLLGIKMGFRVEYQIWAYGLLAAIVVCLITNGRVLLLIPGGIMVYHIEVLRLGAFRYGPSTYHFALIALFGSLSNIIFGTLLKQINIWFFANANADLDRYFVYNLWFAACNLLPLPPLDGSRMLFYSRLLYVFVFGSFVGYWLLAWLGYYSYVISLVIGVIAWLAFYHKYERAT